MWRWFEYGGDGDGGGPNGGAGYGVEVLESGWIPPIPQVGVSEQHSPARIEGLSDIAAFLARVYANQVC